MTDIAQLTPRQQQVYEFIHDKIVNRGYGPTVREIGEQFQISSPNGVMCHLKALEKKGLIHRSPNKSRAIELTQHAIDAERGLPLVGCVAAGATQLAFEQQDRIDFDDFCLIVVQSEAPYRVKVFHFNLESLLAGKFHYRRALFTWAECEKNGWKDYQADEEISIPFWALKEEGVL